MMPVLSTRNSTLPALISLIACATFGVTVPVFGFGISPRGLMPNPKTGTVTPNVAQAIKEIKAGKVEFRVDKTGIIHAPLGKTSFSAKSLIDNAHALVDSVVRAKPAAAKGKYLKSVTVSSTMGPGVAIDTAHIDERGKG
jgi:large subunit ribosomal protein L1